MSQLAIRGNGRGSRRGNNLNKRVNAIFRSKLHNLHLNSAPHWYEKKTRAVDIPPYVADTIYARRIRLQTNISAIQPTDITYANIIAAAGLTSAFQKMFIRSISIWGDDTANIIVTPYLAIFSNATVADREFSDFGIPGARRAHVFVEVSPKDSLVISTFTQVAVRLASNATAISSVVCDFMCELSGTNTSVLFTPQQSGFDELPDYPNSDV